VGLRLGGRGSGGGKALFQIEKGGNPSLKVHSLEKGVHAAVRGRKGEKEHSEKMRRFKTKERAARNC